MIAVHFSRLQSTDGFREVFVSAWWPRLRGGWQNRAPSGQDGFDDVAVDVGQAEVAALGAEG
jgi:hypothetical protein